MALPLQECVVLLGDSFTQRQEVPGNLHERMNQAYIRRLDVINRGFGGYNTNGIRVLLNQIFSRKDVGASAHPVRLLTIWIGINDSTLSPEPASLPLPTFIENLNFILSALTAPSSLYAIADTPLSIILITPGPSRLFRDAVLTVGEEWKAKAADAKAARPDGMSWALEMVDFWGDVVRAAGGEGEELRPYLADGVHLSTAGYDIVWAGIRNVIQTKLAGRGLDWEKDDDLPWRVPEGGDVDWTRPQSVLEGMKKPPFGSTE